MLRARRPIDAAGNRSRSHSGCSHSNHHQLSEPVSYSSPVRRIALPLLSASSTQTRLYRLWTLYKHGRQNVSGTHFLASAIQGTQHHDAVFRCAEPVDAAVWAW